MKKISRCVILLVVFAAALSLASAAWAAVHEQVILTFTGDNGMWPLSPLLRDASGRLYGATLAGGPSSSQCPIGCGVVFELIPKAGGWTYRTLYAFLGGNDSSGPVGKLVFDASGNLYGAALGGGANGAGTVFKLSPGVGGQWTESVLHSFGSGLDGSIPESGLTMDSAGNLYGTTQVGGAFGNPFASGTVYELTPNPDGSWTETVLHSFGGPGDGDTPLAELILDAAGNLYGTTNGGGPFGNFGTVFELSLVSGVWTENILHSFNGTFGDAGGPHAPLLLDSSGNLFGTYTSYLGAAFELTPNPDGSWTYRSLHGFSILTDGAGPYGGLVAKGGALYGTTSGGGLHGTGTVYGLMPFGGGWKEPQLYSFGPNFSGNDGMSPFTGVTFGKGVIYGTTLYGGSANDGVIYEITP